MDPPLFLSKLFNRKAVLSLIFILVFLAGSFSLPINAVIGEEGEGDLVDIIPNYNLNKNPTNKFVETTNGKMVYMQVEPLATSVTFYFNVYSDVTHTANVSYTYSYSPNWITVFDYSIYELNSNEVICFILTDNERVGYSDERVLLLKFNTATNAITMYYINLYTIAWGYATYNSGYISEVIKISTNYYVVTNFCWIMNTAPHNNIEMVKYDGVSTLSSGAEYIEASGNASSISGFLNNAQDHYYFVTSCTADSRAKYFDATISTMGIVLLATEGAAGHYPVSLTKSNFIYGLGGGIITNGTISTMYFAYTYPYDYWVITGYINSIKFEQHRITFNNTISSANVLQQQDRVAYLGEEASDVIHNYPSFGWEMNQTSYIIHYINNLGEDYGGYQYAKGTILITDWYNMSGGGIGTTVDTDMRDNPEFGMNSPFYGMGYIGITPTSRYVFRYGGTIIVRIYLIEPVTVEWDMTITYAPLDSPLQTLTQYRFDIYVTGNDVGKSDCALTVYVDNVAYKTFVPEAGFIDFTYLTSIAGMHEFEFILVDMNFNEVIIEKRNYLFRNIEGGGVEEGLTIMNIEFIMSILPIGLIAGGCAALFFEVTKHWIGFIGGLTFGVLICCAAGMLPFYALIILVIIDLLLMVFARNNTGG